MPVSKIISGLLYKVPLDSLSEGFAFTYGIGSWYVDTATKKEGAASIKIDGYSQATNCAAFDFPIAALPTGCRIHLWHKALDNYHSWEFRIWTSYIIPQLNGDSGTVLFSKGAIQSGQGAAEDWHLYGGTWSGAAGFYWLNDIVWSSVTGGQHIVDWIDGCVISTSQYLTVTGLVQGQKVKAYRTSDNTLIDTQTCGAPPATSVALNVDAEDYPEQMYLKVYGTDGATLLETTTSYEMCGGDAWDWDAGVGTIELTSDVMIIYRGAAVGTPKIANLTANLKTLAGVNYPGASIQFTTPLGTMTPASDTTDANGNAESALTSTTHGLAIVKATWIGDASVPACSIYCVVHVFYEAEAGDSDKEYQFFLEGIEYGFVQGHYAWNEQGKRETFEIEIPEYVSTITRGGLVSIYRRGVKDFAGVLKGRERSLSDAPRVILRGADISVLLDRCVELEIYPSKTPQFIINDLLTKYPCGILAGNLGTCAAELTITIDTESLGDAIQRICSAVNWNFRVTLGRTLDFAETFTGGIVPVTFEEGVKILDAKWSEDDYALANWIRMKGDGITSTKQDGAAIAAQGLHQAPAFQKTISDQTTLDTMCQALLDLSKTVDESVRVEAVDDYDVGAFTTEDQVTVTSPTIGLSGTYTIKRIERDMTQPRVVIMDLSNRPKEFWDLDAEYRRMTKDVNV
jgi:hypothetical protein